MMGKVFGVATTIKNELNKDALAIHCHARTLGLQWLFGANCGFGVKWRTAGRV